MNLIAKWISQALLILAALLSGNWSLIDLLGLVQRDGTVRLMGFTLSGEKSHIELAIRVVASVGALLLVAMTDVLDVYKPRRRLRDFRTEYLKHQAPEWKTQLGASDIRMSLLYARRRWFWPFWRVFDWAWSDGFTPPDAHQDVNLPLACWQGVSGQALRSGIPKKVQFNAPLDQSFDQRWLLRNKFRLTRWQLDRTTKLKSMISVPLLRRGQGSSPSYKAVGVINLDALTDNGAQLLSTNENALIMYFVKAGQVLAFLDM